MIAIDTNVLVYAHRGETDLHAPALARLTALCEGRAAWALPAPCLSEFFRVVTHQRVFNPPTKVTDAVDFARAVLRAPSCRLLTPGRDYAEAFFEVVRSADARGNLVVAAQIVALCREQGIDEVITNDRDFERFGMKVLPLG